jgi:hypothetical protein
VAFELFAKNPVMPAVTVGGVADNRVENMFETWTKL